jgi:hypothetical protein
MPGVLIREPLSQENMTKMTSAGGTHNLRPVSIGIGNPLYSTRNFIIEGRPSAMGVEFIIGTVKWGIATLANIRSFSFEIFILSGERGFGSFIKDYTFFSGG